MEQDFIMQLDEIPFEDITSINIDNKKKNIVIRYKENELKQEYQTLEELKQILQDLQIYVSDSMIEMKRELIDSKLTVFTEFLVVIFGWELMCYLFPFTGNILVGALFRLGITSIMFFASMGVVQKYDHGYATKIELPLQHYLKQRKQYEQYTLKYQLMQDNIKIYLDKALNYEMDNQAESQPIATYSQAFIESQPSIEESSITLEEGGRQLVKKL